jgi:hypothetical protein
MKKRENEHGLKHKRRLWENGRSCGEKGKKGVLRKREDG